MKTKILYVLDSYKTPNAGTEKQVFNLISNIDLSKFEPHLLVFENSEYLHSKQLPCDYTLVELNGVKSIFSWIKMMKVALDFKRKGFQIVHTFFIDASIFCPPIFSLLGMKVIISRRDMGYWYSPSYKTLLKLTGKFVTAVTTNSKAVKAVTHESEGIPNDKIHVIYNGYDMSIPTKVKSNKANSNSIKIVLVANIRPLKRIEDMLDALEIIVNDYPNTQFIHIGGGDSTKLKSKALQKGISENCTFLGEISDVYNHLNQANIGVLCSESEGFSNSILEYQLAGLPVICSNVGGNPEAIEPGETGYLYNVGDIQELSDNILSLLSNPEKMELMGQKGKARAQEKYNIKNVVKQNQDLYLKL